MISKYLNNNRHNQQPHRESQARPKMLARIRAREQSGQALVELAIVLPLLLVVLFGITEFGLALNSANDETHLASEVARYAAVGRGPNGEPVSLSELAAWGKSQADTSFLQSKGEVCISFPNGTAVGNPVKVQVKAPMQWLPILKVGPETTISGSATMRLEVPPTSAGGVCA